jgi:hypothetical protein
MLQKPEPHGFELINHVPIFCSDIAIRDSYAYLANGWDGFSIFDMNDISSPSLLGKLHTPNYVWSVNVCDNNTVCIAEHPREEGYGEENADIPIIHPSGVQFIDISNPNNPFEINRYLAADFVDDVVTHNNHLFILANHHPEPFKCTLLIVYLQDYKNPVLIGECSISGRGHQLVISNHHAYIATFDGLHVIDISKFNNPNEIHHVGNHLSLEGSGIDCDSQNLYVASCFQGLRIFKIQTGTSPIPLSRTILWGIADNVAVNSNIAYVSDIFYGLWRFDLTNLENPLETGFFPVDHGNRRIKIAHSHIFVAAGHAGLFILRETQGQRDLNINRKPGHTVVFDD